MTNAEFLNKNFGTHYKAWMKCKWYYAHNLAVWMIHFDGATGAPVSGWKNYILDGKVIEEYVDDPRNQLESHKYFSESYRLVVDKSQNYKILGVYKFDETNCIMRTRLSWIKVANSLEEFLQKK